MFIAIILSFFITYFANFIYPELPNSIQAEAYSDPIKDLRCNFKRKQLTIPQVYSERSRTSKMEISEKIFFSRSPFTQKTPSQMFDTILNTPLELLTIFAKSSILDVKLRSEYAYGIVNYFCKRLRSNHRRCSVRKGDLGTSAKFTGKHLCQSLFLIELQAWHRCFPVNFVKFLIS